MDRAPPKARQQARTGTTAGRQQQSPGRKKRAGRAAQTKSTPLQETKRIGRDRLRKKRQSHGPRRGSTEEVSQVWKSVLADSARAGATNETDAKGVCDTGVAENPQDHDDDVAPGRRLESAAEEQPVDLSTVRLQDILATTPAKNQQQDRMAARRSPPPPLDLRTKPPATSSRAAGVRGRSASLESARGSGADTPRRQSTGSTPPVPLLGDSNRRQTSAPSRQQPSWSDRDRGRWDATEQALATVRGTVTTLREKYRTEILPGIDAAQRAVPKKQHRSPLFESPSSGVTDSNISDAEQSVGRVHKRLESLQLWRESIAPPHSPPSTGSPRPPRPKENVLHGPSLQEPMVSASASSVSGAAEPPPEASTGAPAVEAASPQRLQRRPPHRPRSFVGPPRGVLTQARSPTQIGSPPRPDHRLRMSGRRSDVRAAGESSHPDYRPEPGELHLDGLPPSHGVTLNLDGEQEDDGDLPPPPDDADEGETENDDELSDEPPPPPPSPPRPPSSASEEEAHDETSSVLPPPPEEDADAPPPPSDLSPQRVIAKALHRPPLPSSYQRPTQFARRQRGQASQRLGGVLHEIDVDPVVSSSVIYNPAWRRLPARPLPTERYLRHALHIQAQKIGRNSSLLQPMVIRTRYRLALLRGKASLDVRRRYDRPLPPWSRAWDGRWGRLDRVWDGTPGDSHAAMVWQAHGGAGTDRLAPPAVAWRSSDDRRGVSQRRPLRTKYSIMLRDMQQERDGRTQLSSTRTSSSLSDGDRHDRPASPANEYMIGDRVDEYVDALVEEDDDDGGNSDGRHPAASDAFDGRSDDDHEQPMGNAGDGDRQEGGLEAVGAPETSQFESTHRDHGRDSAGGDDSPPRLPQARPMLRRRATLRKTLGSKVRQLVEKYEPFEDEDAAVSDDSAN